MLAEKIKLELDKHELADFCEFAENACKIQPVKATDFDTKLVVAVMMQVHKRLVVKNILPKERNKVTLSCAEAIVVQKVWLKYGQMSWLNMQRIVAELNQQLV